ncbi:MAG TPA: hypothetical protein VFS20_14920 [Longimicrobium sp.]|nr:hypothetical protein [Longimicrobium sp.]
MTKMKVCAALAALALALPSAAAAQNTPEAAAERFLQTLKARDWSGNAAAVHPVELDSMKAAFVEVAGSDTSTAGIRAIFNVASVAELRALAPAMVYQRFAANVVGQREGMAEFLAGANFRVLGAVPAGDTAYVVYRVTGTAGGGQASQVTVMALRRDGAGWKARLTDEVRGMIAGLRGAVEQRRISEATRQRALREAAAADTAAGAGRARPSAAPPPARP